MDKALTIGSCLAMGLCIVLMLVGSFLGIADNLAQEPARVAPHGATYQEAYRWCEDKFAGEDLKRSCQWGAYTTTVGTEVTVEASR